MEAAWIGVAATVLGAVAGFVGIYVVERSRRQHEVTQRFVDIRRAAYARLIAASRLLEQIAVERISDLEMRRQRPELSVPIRPRPDMSEVEEVVAEIGLLADYAVELRAAQLSRTLSSLCFAVDLIEQVGTDDAHADLRAAMDNVREARRHFAIAAKADLELPSGALARRQELVWRVRHRLGLVQDRRTNR